MSRRKSVVAPPEPATAVLRRSARLRSDDFQKPGKYGVSGSGSGSDSVYALDATEVDEAAKNSHRDIVHEVSKRLVYQLAGSISGVNLKKSLEMNGSRDGFCSLRRSPRFSSQTCSNFEREKSTQCSSSEPSSASTSHGLNSFNGGSCTLRRSPRLSSAGGSVDQSSSSGKKLGKRVPVRCDKNTKKGEGKDGMDSSERICSETKQILGACDVDRVKKRKSNNGCYREEENGRSSLNFDSIREFAGEKRREIVLGLREQASLKSDRGPANVDEEERIRGDKIDSRLEVNGLKMNNKLDGKSDYGFVQGWTKEQELALQKAYFTAKPSPNFWKKVSKLVAGKSARECFDKVHSDLITPRQPQPRSRAKKTNLSPIPQFSLSASKLLRPTRPRANGKPRKTHFAKRTVRHLLEKQCHVDQDNGLDLFSVLEPNTRNLVDSTPNEKRASLEKTLERSSSAHKKSCSRLTNVDATTLTSPPVLKRIKNKALHEKYIDQLHLREAKRKAESARVCGKENIVNPIDVQKSVRAVKDSLFFDVKDAIEKLKCLNADDSPNSSEFCYDRGESEEEEECMKI